MASPAAVFNFVRKARPLQPQPYSLLVMVYQLPPRLLTGRLVQLCLSRIGGIDNWSQRMRYKQEGCIVIASVLVRFGSYRLAKSAV